MLTWWQCTGAADFIPWYSATAIRCARRNNAIILAVDYPLGPEGNYADIHAALEDFLRWYKEDGCFEVGYQDWRKWLYAQNTGKSFTIDKDHVYVEGESAGGLAAVMALWINADRRRGMDIPVKFALLRYPMIAHYSRVWPTITDENPTGAVIYMGTSVPKEKFQRDMKIVKEVILRLEKYNLVPTCAGRPPPIGMAFAVLLSVTQEWQAFFQRQHGATQLKPSPDTSDKTILDGIQRAEMCAQDTVDPNLLPRMRIYHGHDDPNCPLQNTEKFVELLRDPKLYGDRFKTGDSLTLDVVTELKEKKWWDAERKELIFGCSTTVAHGFDYYLDEASEPFLKRAYNHVESHWGRKV